MIRFGCLLILVTCLIGLSSSTFAQETAPGMTIHVVQRGENLYQIALDYGLKTEELALLNGITDPGNIQVGQRLLVPSSFPSRETLTQAHMVQAGETFESIAALYDMTLEELLSANSIADVNSIYLGQILLVTMSEIAEASPEVVEIAPPPSVSVYVVQPGETLFRIATNYGLTVNELAQANSLSDPTLIYAGQQLVIPGQLPQQLAVTFPEPITGIDVTPLIFVEGQSGRFRLTTSQPVTLAATFLDRPLTVISEQGNTVHTMLTGVPIFTEAGIYPVLLTLTNASGGQSNFSINIQIVAGVYESEMIDLLDDRAGLLDPTVENYEQSLIQGVMSNFTPSRYFDGTMSLPAAATMTSPFGTRRSYNGGGFDRFHTGTDFAGAPGTPVLASAPGVVVLVDTLNVRGKATIIDHGWGVFSGYWHQTEQYVQIGQTVTTGQVIGTIGSTGRVTGAHLHWEMWVGGVPVDPMQWVRQSFS
jgi:murein DD-endopeptidase MepM/ murein hydrolase activator NlpD